MTAAETITADDDQPTVYIVDPTEKDALKAAGWACIGASTLPGGPTVYWLQPGGAA